MSRATLIAFACLVTACKGPEVVEAMVQVPPIRYYYDTASPPPCAATAQFLAETSKRQAAYLGLSVPPRIDYHYWSGRSLSSECPPEGPACAAVIDGVPTIWSQYAAIPHELVHAIVFPAQPMRFFAEAVAVALGGDDGNPDFPVPYLFDSNQVLDKDGANVPTIAFYGIAGDFGSYAIDRWGPLDFSRLNPLVPRGTDTAGAETAFANVFGESMASAFDDRNRSVKRYASGRLGFPECGVDAVPWTGPAWMYSGTLDCSISGISSSDDPTGMTTYAALEVPDAGFYRVRLGGSASSRRFDLQRCLSGEQFDYTPSLQPQLTHATISGSSPLIFAWLPQARHFLRYVADREPVATLDVSIAPAPTASDHCGTTSVDVGVNADGIFAVSPWDGPTAVVPFTVSQNRTAAAVLREASLWLCDGLCDASGAGCQALTPGESVSLSTGHSYALVSTGNGLHSFAGFELTD